MHGQWQPQASRLQVSCGKFQQKASSPAFDSHSTTAAHTTSSSSIHRDLLLRAIINAFSLLGYVGGCGAGGTLQWANVPALDNVSAEAQITKQVSVTMLIHELAF